ncbi:MAG: hypothetical protein J6R26_04610 [Paludibacteraceae bacterium]|nr:hypothetical protein [Paludibacteraceae bacterium]
MKKIITLFLLTLLILPASTQAKVKVAGQVGKALKTKGAVSATIVKTGQAIQQSTKVSPINISPQIQTQTPNIFDMELLQKRIMQPIAMSDSINRDILESNQRRKLSFSKLPDVDVYSSIAEQYPDSLFYVLRPLELPPHVEPQYVDLGLPSGTLWKDYDEPGMYTQTEKDSLFQGSLPTAEQFAELRTICTWEWDTIGYKVTGPNGNSITFKAKGYCSSLKRYYFMGDYGSYWLAPYTVGADVYTNLFFRFTEKGINACANEYAGARNVRLVKLAANQ